MLSELKSKPSQDPVDSELLAVVNSAQSAHGGQVAAHELDLNRARRMLSKQVEARYEAVKAALNGNGDAAYRYVNFCVHRRHYEN